jgi:hypothetical protein
LERLNSRADSALAGLSHGGGNDGKGEFFGGAAVLLAPLVKEAAVTEGDVVGGSDAEAERGAVDPLGGAFEFSVVADGGFVDDAVSLRAVMAGVGPFGAPLFIAKRGDEAEGEKKLGERSAMRDLRFGFDAMLVPVFTRLACTRKALVSQRPVAGVAANAEDFGAGTHLAVGSVVEGVRLEAARCFEAETGGLKAQGQGRQVVDTEFDLGFDGHGYNRV